VPKQKNNVSISHFNITASYLNIIIDVLLFLLIPTQVHHSFIDPNHQASFNKIVSNQRTEIIMTTNTDKNTSPKITVPSPAALSCGPDADEMDASPLHLHVIENARLVGKPTSRSSSRSRSRSNSREPSHSRRNSWRLDDVVQVLDPDIFTDQKGHEELDCEPRHASDLTGTLPSLNERMSDEALDDCHAFTDLKDAIRQISNSGGGAGTGGTAMTAASSNASGVSSRSSENSLSREGSLAGGSLIGDGGHLLETLEEFEEEEEGSEGDVEDGEDEFTVETEVTEQTACTAQTEQAANTKKRNALLLKKEKNVGKK
jgi:hypothetical protein